MRDIIIRLLDDIDQFLETSESNSQKVELLLIGGAALTLTHAQRRATKDIDFYAQKEIPSLAKILREFGRNSPGHKKHGIYVERVGDFASVPPVAGVVSRSKSFDSVRWRRLRVLVASPMDLIISKIRSFRPSDRFDIKDICTIDRDKIDLLQFTKIFEDTVWYFAENGEEAMRARFERILQFIKGETDEL